MSETNVGSGARQMTKARSWSLSIIAGLALYAVLGSGVGESSDPTLRVAELPVEVLNDCAAVPVAASSATCADAGYQIRWLSHTPHGHLFLVEHDRCNADGCRAWLIEKQAGGTQVLLALVGEYRLDRNGAYPSVQLRAELSNSYTSYNRYTWDGNGYTRSETRMAHRVDGFECASEDDCERAAQQALNHNQVDRAVRIWQQVHGVDWI
ncbi:MAG: hypothetical protein HY308_15995 [Gammaproteobacteria bacterium]|nr:hypothetical protein [Gammaproteobacteria bacterium]